MRRIFAVVALSTLLAGGAAADTLLLEDGRLLDGPAMTVREDGVAVALEAGEIIVPDRLARRVFDAQDPADMQDLTALRDHAQWRNRRRVEAPPFVFEHNVPPHVFQQLRRQVDAYLAALSKALFTAGEASPTPETIRFSIYDGIATFHQLAGVGGSIRAYVRFAEPQEIDASHDPLAPEESARGMQFAVASWWLVEHGLGIGRPTSRATRSPRGRR